MTPTALPAQDCAAQVQHCAEAAQASPLQLAKRSAKGHLRQLPSQIKLRYQLSWNGLPANGELQWQRDGVHYRTELKLAAVVGPTFRYQSEGHIDGNGLVPEQYRAWRNNQPRESAQFDWPNKTVKYGEDEQKEAALETGAQDFLSLDWQLAMSGGKHLPSPLQVTNGKKVYRYPINKSGETQENGLAVSIFRAKHDNDLTEFWLAREFYNLPTKIVYKDEQKNLELTATQIEVDGKVVWPK